MGALSWAEAGYTLNKLPVTSGTGSQKSSRVIFSYLLGVIFCSFGIWIFFDSSTFWRQTFYSPFYFSACSLLLFFYSQRKLFTAYIFHHEGLFLFFLSDQTDLGLMCEYNFSSLCMCNHTPAVDVCNHTSAVGVNTHGDAPGRRSGDILPAWKEDNIQAFKPVCEYIQLSMYSRELCFTFIFLSTWNQLLSWNALWGNRGNTHAITHFCSVHWRMNARFLLPPLHLQSKQKKVRLFSVQVEGSFSCWMKQPVKSQVTTDVAPLPNMEHCSSLRGLMRRLHAHAEQCRCVSCDDYGDNGLPISASLSLVSALPLSLMAPAKMCNPAPPLIPSVTLICLCNRVRLGH